MNRHFRFIVSGVILCVVLCCRNGVARTTNLYSSRDRERPRRPHTNYIVLHTTEGPAAGSLRKVRRNGETHYFVDTGGHVYRIIRREKVAFHAGRSMWQGKVNLDNYSIGIEIVGYHNRLINAVQVGVVRELIAELQRIYVITDDRVLTHSMVAYGAPNEWHRKSHRGRKRCAMLLATSSMRRKLGLGRHPVYDPDVKAGRLVVGDPYLARVLYGSAREQDRASERFASTDANVISATRSAWDIARDKYDSADTLYRFPDGRELRGNEIGKWKQIPPGTRVVIAGLRGNERENVIAIVADGRSAKDIAGDEYAGSATIYFLPDGRVRSGEALAEAELTNLPAGTRMLVGYACGGYITASRSAFDVCGERWNFPSTFYRFSDGSIKAGNKVNENAIPKGTQIFFRN